MLAEVGGNETTAQSVATESLDYLYRIITMISQGPGAGARVVQQNLAEAGSFQKGPAKKTTSI